MFGPNVEWLLGICTGVITIDKIIDIALKFKNRANEPSEKLDLRITDLERRVSRHDEILDSDKARLDDFEKGNRILQRSILALLKNKIDGTEDDLLKAREALENYLIER